LFGATTTVQAQQEVSFGKAFVPNIIGPGSVTTLLFNITNYDSATPLTNLAFTDTLPSGVFIATPANATTTCDSVLDAPDGGSTISFSADRLGPSSTCLIAVDVTSSAFGVHTNTSGHLTADSDDYGYATANLAVDQMIPGFSKSFSPSSIPPAGTSTLTFIIDNTASQVGQSSLSFADYLPPGMVIATPTNAFTDCGEAPVLTAASGTNYIIFEDGYVGGFSSCSVSVDVTVSDFGEYVNSSGILAGQMDVAAWTGGRATAVLDASRKFLLKSFTDDPVMPGDTVSLEFTLTNLDRTNDATDISFSDDLDDTLAGLEAIGLPLADPCGAGSQLAGTSALAFTGGSLLPQASCTFSVTLQVPVAASTGAYTNTTSIITAQVGGDIAVYDPATDHLLVSSAPLLTKTFVNDPVAPGDTVTLTFSITNVNPVSYAYNIAFIDELTTFFPFPVTVGLPSDNFCGDASSIELVSLGTDRQGLSMTGGNLAAGASCNFSVTLQVPVGIAGGVYVNTTGDITAVFDGEPVSGLPATDELTVVAAPDLHKTFDDPVIPGDVVTLTFSISHDDLAPGDATDIAFSDDLSAVLPGLTATNLPLNDVCGAGSLLSGATNLSFTGGSLAPGETCVFSVTLQTPLDAISGIFTNQTSNVTANVLGLATMGNPAQDNLTVSGLALSKTFVGDPVIPGDTVILEFVLVNASTVHSATTIYFTDDLESVLSGLTATDLPQTGVCGPGSQITGTTSLTFQGGSLDQGQACTFSATLQVPPGAASGTYNNVTGVFSATIDGTPATLANAADQLTVSADWLLFSKSFSDGPVAPGDTVSLEFTLTNLHATQSVMDVAFTDDLDAVLPGLAAIGLPENDVCGAGSQITGTSELALTGGDLEPGASCMFSVTLQTPAGAAFGAYNNTTSDATGAIGGLGVRGDPALDELLLSGLTFSKSFDGPTVVGGNPVLTFMIHNPSASATASDISFSDDLGAVIPGLVATGLPKSDVCGSSSLFEGASLLNLRYGSLEPGASCAFSVTLQVPPTASVGSFVNTTSELLLGGIEASAPATATLTLLAPADIGDYVWYDADQDGIQDGGEAGIADVTVNLYDAAGTSLVQLGSTTTGADGLYSFTDLVPGDYMLEFVLPDGFVFTLQDQGADDALDSDADPATGQTTATTLEEGESDLNWDAGMYELTAVIGDYVWYDADQDGIQDGGEMGIAGVTVNLRDGANTTQLDSTTTGADGLYSFTDLVPGDYTLEFVLPDGFVFSLQDQGADDAADSDADPLTGQTMSTTLEPGENDSSWDAGMYESLSIAYMPLVACNYAPAVLASDLAFGSWHRR
jgi:hypothetical protein